jgi:aspartate aminotransferase
MSQLSHLAETLIGSEIVKLGNAINERIRNGETIYNYTIGDFNPSEFPIPAELEQLIIEAYQQKKTSYPQLKAFWIYVKPLVDLFKIGKGLALHQLKFK